MSYDLADDPTPEKKLHPQEASSRILRGARDIFFKSRDRGDVAHEQDFAARDSRVGR